MRSAGVFSTLAAVAFVGAQAAQPQSPVASPAPLNTPDEVSPVAWVNTYIGTGGGGSDFSRSHSSTESMSG
jgi:hypothetical protein